MQFMSVIHLQCCENQSEFEIEYEIGTTYLVCKFCLEKPHFMRGIKDKKEIRHVTKRVGFQLDDHQPRRLSDCY